MVHVSDDCEVFKFSHNISQKFELRNYTILSVNKQGIIFRKIFVFIIKALN
jgi:hypothetical protein